MNDTNLNKRQTSILDLLESRGGLSRAEIATLLSNATSTSRITLIRDLNKLVELGHVSVEGKGKSTTYKIIEKNPILREINISTYFQTNFNERNIHAHFNDEIYVNLSSLFTQKEQIILDNAKKSYARNVKDLEPSIYKRELERFIIEFSWKSSQIEGNTYDLLETETLIKQKIEAKGRTKEEAIMILNHKYAFDSILNNTQTFKQLRFGDVTQLHGLMIKNLNVPSGIRSQAVRITGTLYNPISIRQELDVQLRKIISHINSTTYPPDKALIAACMIAYLQPFADGNKRTARMLSNAILIAHGYFPLSYRDVDVNEFVKAMVIFYEQNNLYHIKKIFMEQMQFSADNYFQIK
ncbi:MAG: Fic family protein [bacterium]|nr:Fic family protein [bacterium]